MLELVEHSPECHFSDCSYALRGHCGLNAKTDNPMINKRCVPSDNWYITGSFVLDDIFGKVTANDIDLVVTEGEMPEQLPARVLRSPLRIEMLWNTPEQEAAFRCHNVNLPRLTSHGLINTDVANAMLSDRLITVLPRRKKLTMLSICSAIKPMVKYDMKPSQRTLKIWNDSILNPPGLKKGLQFISDNLPIESVDWDYVRAGNLIDYCGLALKKALPTHRRQYLAKLYEVLLLLDLRGDIAYDHLLSWLGAGLRGDDGRQSTIEKSVHMQGFKLRESKRD